MKLIAHRGLIHGPDPHKENDPRQIAYALSKGYDVETDVWFLTGRWFLGHDTPEHEISFEALSEPGLWLHCKNFAALHALAETDLHYFWHEDDNYTLTSRGVIWAYPKQILGPKAVWVQPEWSCKSRFSEQFLHALHPAMDWRTNVAEQAKNIAGICSKYVVEIERLLR